MKYSQFEKLVITLGAAAILGTLLLSLPSGGPGLTEIIAQLMLLLVLVVAVHYGPKGGLIAAIVASVIYIAMRIPTLAGDMTLGVSAMVLVRLAAYGLVGVVGGELCGRIKYVFARYDDSSTIDDWSHVYNQRYAARALEQALGRFTRYGEAFSVVVIALSPSLTSELRPSRQRALVRGVANCLRDDIRMVDEVARLNDGRFLILLPHTPREGAMVVNARLEAGVCHTLGAREASVTANFFGAAEDGPALEALASDIADKTERQEASAT